MQGWSYCSNGKKSDMSSEEEFDEGFGENSIVYLILDT